MAEFETSRRMPADAETVFRVAADLDRMVNWLPTTIEVESAGPDQVHVEGKEDGHPYSAEGLFRPRPEQLRVEWGSRDTGDYAGWLQVAHSGDDASEATLHLSFFGKDMPETHGGEAAARLRTGMDEALARLEQEITAKA